MGQARKDESPQPLSAYASQRLLRWLSDEPGVRHRRSDASLVLADVSGFTPLVERLSRLGQMGAEEVTDVLNITFSNLLSVAREDGASLLKFGGDALLLYLDGPDHAVRAVHSALRMRKSLRELQPFETSAGRVHLRMSIGVHAGEVDELLVGTVQRELLVIGPTVAELLRLEAAAQPGQILVSPAVRERIGDTVATTRSGPGHVVRGVPTPTASAPLEAPMHASDELAAALLPAQLLERLAQGTPESEHRSSVVAFVRFTGVNELLAGRGPKRTAEKLERVVDAVVDAAASYEVCVLASDVLADGGKLLVTAGVPHSDEHDGERMLRTVRRLVDARLPLGVHVGVHCGPIFAGVVGPPFRTTYTVFGDVVNTAARLMAHAAPGEILATPAVLDRSQSRFEAEELSPIPVKGKRRAVPAVRVGPPTSERMRRERARHPLAGRDAEMEVLLGGTAPSGEVTGRIVEITGPPGIGKTRLTEELHERRAETPFVRLACGRYEATTPYAAAAILVRRALDLRQPLRTSELRAAVRDRAPALRAALPLIGEVLGVPVADNATTRALTAGNRAERVVAAVTQLLATTLPEPLILVVDDVHWIDPESWAVLQALCRSEVAQRSWLVVLTSREPLDLGDPSLPHWTMALEPLTETQARELVYAAVEEGRVPLERGLLSLEKSGGNPFFLRELLEAPLGGELPETVEALVHTQLDQLDARDRELLSVGAVLGIEMDVDLLHAASGISVARQRATFRRLGAYVEPLSDKRFRFRHALLQEGAYTRLPFRRRHEIHRGAAEALEARPDPPADLLAIHTSRAGDWERARRFALEAARGAAARFANLTAAELYRLAIDAGHHLRGTANDGLAATMWEELGDVLLYASSYEEAAAAYRRARRLAGPEAQVRLCTQIGQIRERQSRFAEALGWFTRAVRLGGDAAAGGRPLVEAAIVRIRQGRLRDARALADRADSAESDLQTLARVSYVRAWSAMLLGEPTEEHSRRTLELFESANDVVGQGLAWNIISMAAYYRGDWDQAATGYERAGALRELIGDDVAAAAAAGNLGELLSDQGHFERARPLVERCRAVCGAAGYHGSHYFAVVTMGRLEARLGRFGESAALLEQALSELESIGRPDLASNARRYQAELFVFQGDDERALASARDLHELAALGSPSLRETGTRIRVAAQLLRGDTAAALESAAQLVSSLDLEANDYETALSLVAAATAFEVAAEPQASAVGARAQRILDRLGVVVPGWRLVFGPAWGQTKEKAPDFRGLS